MDFKIDLSESGKYAIVRALVPITEAIALRMAEAVEKLSNETGVLDRLIDVRNVNNVMSVPNTYDLAYEGLEGLNINRSIKIASLQSIGDKSHEFACNAVRNAGFNLRVFTDEATAIAWLESGD